MYSQTSIIGNVGGTPEKKEINGTKLCKFSVATHRRWNDDAGNRQEETTWYRVSLWGKKAEILADYITKGRQIHVVGRMLCNTRDDGHEKREFWELRAETITLLGDAPKKEGWNS